MIPLTIALYCLIVPLASLAIVAGAGFAGARLSSGEFSWVRYGAWLAGAFIGAVLMLAAANTTVFLAVAVVLVLWVLLRAAADAQSTTIREKIGFLQLYAGLFLVEYGAMRRAGMLDGARTSAPFAFSLHDYLGHLVLPVSSLFSGGHRGREWTMPAAVLGHVAESVSQHWLLVVALATFGVAAFVYAYFAEHATPRVGVTLLPLPTAMSVAFALSWAAVFVVPSTSVVVFFAAVIAIFLTPFFAAEGVWVFYRVCERLETRTLWVALLVTGALISPVLTAVLSVLGWTFHLVRLRAFEPILGGARRSSSGPRLRTAVVASLAVSVALALLGAADGAALRRVSPRMTRGPEFCGQVTLGPTADGVRVTSPDGEYTIDADETSLDCSVVLRDGAERAAKSACERRHARLCTSDEWYVACLCTYSNESEGGPKTGTNDRLVYRVETDRAAGTQPDIRQLMAGNTEIVAPDGPGGSVLAAGPNDAIAEPFTVDCRYRAFLSDAALRDAAGTLTAVRCCR